MAICLCALLAGCAYYHPSRKVEIVRNDGSTYRSKESAPLVTWFKKGEADMVSSTVDDQLEEGYKRAVGAKNIRTSGDPETLKAGGDAVGSGAQEFLTP